MAGSGPGQRPGGTFFLEVTPLGWRLMGFYGLSLFVLSLVSWWSERTSDASHQMAAMFEDRVVSEAQPFWYELLLHPPQAPAAMHPDGPGFQLWQIVTAPLVYPPGSFGSLALAFLGFAFFGAGVERFFGRKRFLVFWLVSALGAGFGGFLFGPLLQPGGVHFGCGPVVLATIIVYCMITPEAIVSIFMVVPIRLKWIAAMLGGFVLIRALAMTQPLGSGGAAGGYEAGGVLAGYLWFKYGEDFFERRRRRRRAGALLEMVLNDVQKAEDRNEPTFH